MKFKIILIFSLLVILLDAAPLKAQSALYGDTVMLDLPAGQKEAFVKSIQQKLFYLQHFISKISDKDLSIEERLEMIDGVVKLFSDEDNIIEVSNARTGEVAQYAVRQYFRRLAAIPAHRVDVTFYKGIMLETLKRGSDGYFYGTAILFQETVIYAQQDGMDTYRDRTMKRVNFKSKQEYVRSGTHTTVVYETFLQDIKIKETQIL